MTDPLKVMMAEVYFAPTAKRRFLTLRAAANAEASAIIERKYPTEPAEYDCYGMTDSGWHFRQDDRLVRVHARLRNRIYRRARSLVGRADHEA